MACLSGLDAIAHGGRLLQRQNICMVDLFSSFFEIYRSDSLWLRPVTVMPRSVDKTAVAIPDQLMR